jgi:hypothetical protein
VWAGAHYSKYFNVNEYCFSKDVYILNAIQTETPSYIESKPSQIDWFTSRTKFFHLYGDVTIAGEGLQNLGLCSALRAFEQGGIFIVPHLLWHGTSVFPVSSEGPPHSVASYDTRGNWRIYNSNPDPHGIPSQKIQIGAASWHTCSKQLFKGFKGVRFGQDLAFGYCVI